MIRSLTVDVTKDNSGSIPQRPVHAYIYIGTLTKRHISPFINLCKCSKQQVQSTTLAQLSVKFIETYQTYKC